ncbi:hypothetical protein BJV82DRAFT_662450 [Fennellomyces sp. T-0311]|nr:hypothetical protein BJV82DRAFT_662450 [Fennellomyces sp. T-0311]
MQKKNGAKQKNCKNLNGEQLLTKLPSDVTALIISQLTLIEHSDVLPDLTGYDINGKDIPHLFMRYRYTGALKYLVDLGCSNMQTIANVYYSPLLQKLFDLTSHTLTRLELGVASIAISKTTQSAAKLATGSPVNESMSRVADLNLSLPQMDTPQLKRILSFFTGVTIFICRSHSMQIKYWAGLALPSRCYKPFDWALSFHQDCAKQESAKSILKKYTPAMGDFLIQTDLGMEPVYNMIRRFISQGTSPLRSLAVQSRRFLISLPPLVNIEQLLCQFSRLEDLQNRGLTNVKLIYCNGFTAVKLATLINCFCYRMDSVCSVNVDELLDQVLDSLHGKMRVLRQFTLSSKD